MIKKNEAMVALMEHEAIAKVVGSSEYKEVLEAARKYVDSLIENCKKANVDYTIDELKNISTKYSELKDEITKKIIDAITKTLSKKSFTTNEYYQALDEVWKAYIL